MWLRTHVLRPTWHYVHADDAKWLLELTAPRVLPTVDQQLRPLADGMNALIDAVESILAEASDRSRADVAGALADRGFELTGQQLMLLMAHLELHGLVCSGARRGEHTYALLSERAPTPEAARATRPWPRSPCATSPATVRRPSATSRTGPR